MTACLVRAPPSFKVDRHGRSALRSLALAGRCGSHGSSLAIDPELIRVSYPMKPADGCLSDVRTRAGFVDYSEAFGDSAMELSLDVDDSSFTQVTLTGASRRPADLTGGDTGVYR
jgi:hypothetical protein